MQVRERATEVERKREGERARSRPRGLSPLLHRCRHSVMTCRGSGGKFGGGEVLTAHFSRDILGIETLARVESIVEEAAHRMVLDVVFHVPSLAHARIDA
jgi:hypothetical protein